jgi:type I restriction enzyme S subunit
MREGWQSKALADLCETFTDGDWVESKDQAAEGIRLIQTGNVGEGIFKDRPEKARYISKETFEHLRCTEIFDGDCLVSRLPDPVGRSCVLRNTGERMITAVDCTIIRFYPQQLRSTFFCYYSQSDQYLKAVAKVCTGTTRNRISRSNLGLIPIPVPPLPEQQRIVALLDEAFAGLATAKANAEQNLQNARAIFESRLQAIFSRRGVGWVEKGLSEVCTLINGRAYKKDEMLASGKYPLLRVGNFFSNRDWYYSDLELDADKYCDNGDLLYAWSASFGPRIWEGDKVIYHYHIWKVIPNNSLVDKRFLLYLLEWDVDQIKLAHGTGTTMMHVSKGSMESRVVPIPPLHLQSGIVSQLDSLKIETQSLTRIYDRKLAALEELKKSLLHQAFNGDL